jgi:hypothetical protein
MIDLDGYRWRLGCLAGATERDAERAVRRFRAKAKSGEIGPIGPVLKSGEIERI